MSGAVAQVQVPVVGPDQRDAVHGRNSTLRALERQLVERVARRAGDARGELRRLARRQRFEQHAQHALAFVQPGRFAAPRAEDQDELALLAVRCRPPARPAACASGRRATSSNFLVSSRAMTSSRSPPNCAARSSTVSSTRCGRFVEDHRPGQVERGERLAPRAGLRRQEADEQEPVGDEARRREGRHGGVRSRHRHHAQAVAVRGLDQQRARVGDARRAGVGHQRHAAAFAQRGQQLGAGRALVVRVQRDGGALDAVPREQRARGARVLAGDAGPPGAASPARAGWRRRGCRSAWRRRTGFRSRFGRQRASTPDCADPLVGGQTEAA